MKKITLLFFCVISLAFSFNANSQCNYTLEMNDSYGDGWNGNTMNVLVNGTVVLSGVTLDGGAQGTLLFPVNDGDDITTEWLGGGSYAFETSYRILDFFGTAVGAGAETSITTGTITGSCPSCTQTIVDSSVVVDDCAASQFTIDIVVSSVGDGTFITDGLGGSYAVVSGPMSVGPYTIGTEVTLMVEHSDTVCNYTLGSFNTSCVLPGDSCDLAVELTPGTSQAGNTTEGGSFADDGSGASNPCHGSSDDHEYWFEYTAVETGETLDISVSDLEIPYYGVFIFDNCPDSSPNCVVSVRNSNSTDDLAVTTPDLIAGTTYYIVVMDWAESPTPFTLNSVVNAAPTCLEPLNLNATVLTGDTSATVSWDVESGATAGYNWSVMLAGEDPTVDTAVSMGTTGVGVTTDTATGLTAGASYDLYVQSNCDTSGLSTWAGPYNFVALAPPANDDCANAELITVGIEACGAEVTGHNIGATDSGVAQASCATATYAGGDFWYEFVVPTTDTSVIYSRFSSDFSTTQVELYSGSCGTLVEVACTTASNNTFTGLTSGETYYLRMYDWGNDDFGSVAFCLNTPPPPPTNISCATATDIVCGETISGTSVGSTGTQEGSGCTMGSNGVWYTFTGYGGDIIVTVDASFDHELAITSGTCGALVNVGCRDGSVGQEVYTITDSVDGETYYVYIAHYSSSSTTTGTHTINIECPTASIDDFEASNGLSYYPNPVNNTLTLDAKQNIDGVAVYNMLGQEVLRTAPNTVNTEINMSALRSGAYFVKVTIGNATETVRIIKN
ncbi:T9SS type A sorting domain-containing protein [Oceanihabitans sediminis]|uniref:T9SS C-terminal target domain-containing protein n=2 Tax=Oceanihabitans sediminis TaxID=1812012 RepID=A0A368P631_9FLAO|nr:T9SS type A sorting domain-containing protein [Oceanihabitans sediminis]RCU57750.1 T9SS C-terminal target domain-containing protein [Oceanihabitans sediminis]